MNIYRLKTEGNLVKKNIIKNYGSRGIDISDTKICPAQRENGSAREFSQPVVFYLFTHSPLHVHNNFVIGQRRPRSDCAGALADLGLSCSNHYENTPIQIYRKFHLLKTENCQTKNFDILHISAQNIDCGYSLEPPHRLWVLVRTASARRF